MRVGHVGELPAERERAVVINVGTELVTTLTVASLLRHAGMPVLVVNCAPTVDSTEHFDRLMERWELDVVDAPLRRHGHALDAVMRETNAELVLKVDSDAELRDSGVLVWMRQAFEHPRTFGAGFVHGGWWMTRRERAAHHVAMYHERPWTQFVMFRTSHVREVLDAGASFESEVIYNDFRFNARVARLLAARLFGDPRVPRYAVLDRLPAGIKERLATSRLGWLSWARGDFYGHRPSYVFADMGAMVYHRCRYRKALVFSGRPLTLLGDEVHHFGGVTRLALSPWQTNGTRLAAIEGEVIERLATEYGVVWQDLSGMARSMVATVRPLGGAPA